MLRAALTLEKCQLACKPGSVPEISPPRWPFIWDACCQAPQATNPDGDAEAHFGRGDRARCRPYSVLLPAGFALPRLLPAARCALTAPFHPCSVLGLPRFALLETPNVTPRKRFAFCGTFPGVAPAGNYPAPCFRGARTFLHSGRASTANGHSARPKQRPSGQLA